MNALRQWIARPATWTTYALAEGPVWDAKRRRLLWVDIVAGRVHAGKLDGSAIQPAEEFAVGTFAGSVAFTADGELVVAAKEQLTRIRPDGTRVLGTRILPDGSTRRLNDGAVDPGGRFVVGSLSLHGPGSGECLVVVDHDGTVRVLDEDLTLSNGIAWSADGTCMYSVDTLDGVVHSRAWDPASEVVGPRTDHITLAGELPDGIAVDADDHLWVAVWGAGQVRRFTPDGRLTGVVHVNAPHTSAVTFAGDDLRTLVITTARNELPVRALRRYPDSGRLFTARIEVPGLSATPWRPPTV
ncbi:hypothetical protein GCM10023205_73670 [Yinghuangia aomiensis]|uniref:SMP-30/Gluconolactonase/LRE-like region domain-containing protein n=1 Tax=Yinghuangia aomiensis TaxID=676205 RepID=A0ABP9I9A9_9ACTN